MPPATVQNIRRLPRLAERLKEARRNSKLSQRRLAAKLSVSPAAVAQWESGGTLPSTDHLHALVTVLAVSVDWLMGRQSSSDDVDRVHAKDLGLMAEARRLGVDLEAVVADARRQCWLTENRGAIDDANAFLDRHGLWSDGKRLF